MEGSMTRQTILGGIGLTLVIAALLCIAIAGIVIWRLIWPA
jgi:CHASE3 domain sensor protein